MAATVDLSAALGEFGADKATRAELAQVQQALDALRLALGAETKARQDAVTGEGNARAAGDGDEARARVAGDTAEGQARDQAIAAEGQARDQAIAAEARNRDTAIAASVRAFEGAVARFQDTLQRALAAETKARTQADDAERQERSDADDVERKARTAAIAEQQQALSDAGRAQSTALADLSADIRSVTDALSARLFDFVAPAGRPGDAPLRYTLVGAVAALGGPRSGLPILPAGLIAGGDNGPVARVAGAGILAARAGFPVEVGRLYRFRSVIQRRANPSNPSGDAVVCGGVYLDQSLRIIGDVVPVRVYPALSTADGRQECEALISRSVGLGAAFQAPAGARFLVPVVALYGRDAVTDVELLGVEDVTGAFILDTPVADFDARLSRYDTADVLGRLERLEQQAGNPGKLTFASKGDAAYATIPDTVQVVELLGGQYLGDGGAGLFLRIAGDPPAGADTFTSHGAVFRRVPLLPEVAAAILDVGFERFMAGLPVEEPPGSGRRFNNNGFPSVTP